MKDIDFSIFEYRKQKEISNFKAVQSERKNGNFEKQCIKTSTVGYVDIYIYRPKQAMDISLPVYFNFHGGGNVLGFSELDGIYCQQIADEVPCVVINVDYCLAPENKFPKAIYSSYEVISAVKEKYQELNIDKDKIAVGGQSAGGALAAALSLVAKDKKDINFKAQVLNYAPLNNVNDNNQRKVKDAAKAISNDRINQYLQWSYEKIEDTFSPLASPVCADLEGMPPTLIIGAEFDSLLAEEKEYANKAKQANVEVELEVFKECQHGFTHKWLKEYHETEAKRAWDTIIRFLKTKFEE